MGQFIEIIGAYSKRNSYLVYILYKVKIKNVFSIFLTDSEEKIISSFNCLDNARNFLKRNGFIELCFTFETWSKD